MADDLIGGRFRPIGGPVATNVFGRDPRCKDVRCGGSHYHCTHCGAVTGMTGHSDPRACAVARENGLDDPDWVLNDEGELPAL
jgi:hypothetical protein